MALQFPLKKTVKNGVFVPFLPWNGDRRQISKEEALQHYGFKSDRLTILVFGGSQGAAVINEMLPKAISLLTQPVQVLHFTGKDEGIHYEVPAVVKKFETEMGYAYAAADMVVCRSGAGTVAELIRYRLPALLIPYPFAGGHQKENGQMLSDRGGAKLLLQQECTPEKIGKEIESLLLVRDQMRAVLKTIEPLSTQSLSSWVRKTGEQR